MKIFNKHFLSYILAGLALAFMALLVFSAQSFGAETTGADFLMISIGARNSAMADSFGIVGDDMNSIYGNPSSIAAVNSTDITATHNEWLAGIQHEFVGIAQKISGPMVMGIGVSCLHTDMDSYTAAGVKTGAFSNYDLAASLSLATMFSDRLSFGLTAKIIKQQIETYEANGAAMDLGLGYKLGKLRLGCAVTNFGQKMKFIQDEFSLPMTLDAGAGYELESGVITLDVKQQLLEDYTTFGLGAEQWITEYFSIRGGYQYKKENSLGGLFGFTGGIGIRVSQYYIDYSFVPMADLGSAQRISLNVKFGPEHTASKKTYQNFYKTKKLSKQITLENYD
jgi:hypothetical protein